MKTMKLIYPLAFALAVIAAATGCKHNPGKVTVIPNNHPAVVGDPNVDPHTRPTSEPPPTIPFPTDPGVNVFNPPPTKTGGGDMAALDLFDGMIKDSAALAPYTVHFKYDSAAVQKTEQSNLKEVVAKLSSDPTTKLLIEGNCDERGTEEYNRALGERRALALREALAKLGIDPMRVRTISYGKDRPADPGHDEAAWAKNRRGDFILLLPKKSA
jgi:peptidoglycan-associated lipoprotein